ncbi:hypothetical protein GCM10023185_21220 [Hymenobacter saemangeumensis]|uniref:Glycosyltransferase RgtA/B/C/D-like domain-containing protein n=1 Tax=Hymenobacter saemangeumensis TaxID=1084522 RepID=A0ABP8IE44_9BACT
MPSFRFFLLLTCAALLACTGYAALLLSSGSWEEARALDRVFPFYAWHIRPFTLAEYENARAGLALTAALLAAATLALARPPKLQQEIARLKVELLSHGASFRECLRRLAPGQRRLALGLLALLTGTRLYFSLRNPEYDDAVSYEVFVSKGLLAVGGYYPIPNNHVLANTLSWLFYQLYPGFWFCMRLPVLLVSTAGTVWLFGLLLRQSSFRVALLATAGFGWLQLSLYHAGVGRGYWLLTVLAGLVFFSTLALSESPQRPRLAWAGLLGGGILGSYTIPTFALVLASAYSWLGLLFLLSRAGKYLLALLLVGATTVAATLALYAPLLLISGPELFFENGFVASRGFEEFWRGLPAYLWYSEGFLAGQRTVGGLLTLAVLLGLAGLQRLDNQGRLPSNQRTWLRQLAQPALWFVAVPYAVLMVKHVFPPERVLLFKAFFLFILAALVLNWVLDRWPRQRFLPGSMLLLALGYIGYQAWSIERQNQAYRSSNASYRSALAWLAAQPPGPVLIPEPTHNLFFRFYAHSLTPGRRWQFHDAKVDSVRYAYVVAFPNKRGMFQPPISFPPAYRNADVEIFALPRRP